MLRSVGRAAAAGGARRRRRSWPCTCRCTPPRVSRCRSSPRSAGAGPSVPICAYGLYAPLNEDQLRGRRGAPSCSDPRRRRTSWRWRARSQRRRAAAAGAPPTALPRLDVPGARPRGPAGARPLRAGCEWPDGRQAVVGATEATRGCKHRCRHCPIVPVYDGRFRVVPVGGRAGRHPRAGGRRAPSTSRSAIPTSSTARRTRGASSRRCTPSGRRSPTTSTIKVEHLRAHDALLPLLRDTGLRVRDDAPSSRSTTRCWRGSTRATPGPTSRPWSARCRALGLALVADLHRLHAVDDAGRRIATFLDDVEALGSGRARGAGAVDAASARHLAVAAARARRRPAPSSAPFDPAHADVSVGASGSGGRSRCSAT